MVELDAVKKEQEDLMRRGAALVGRDVRDAEVRDFISEHYRFLGNFYTPNKEIYRGLADVFASDERFQKHFDAYAPGFAEFMSEAMKAWVEEQ